MSWFNFWAKFKKKDRARVYLDFAAATPLRTEVKEKMEEVAGLYANPSAIHKEGVKARKVIEEQRLRLARTLKVRPEGVTFTGNGTESNNLAIFGLLRALKDQGRDFSSMEIISTKLEHPSIEEVLKHLAEYGVTIHHCNVNAEGKMDVQHLISLLNERTVLVTFAYVNSEVGVVQDVPKIARAVKKFNQQTGQDIKVHTDAAQAPLWLPCQLDGLGVDMMSLDAGKCYGPKGVGVLVTRHGVVLKGVLLGGGQESGLRSGTENTQSVVGAVESLVLAQEGREERSQTVAELRNKAIKKLKTIEGVSLNGSVFDRVANNINISVDGVDGEFAVISLDEAGFAISTKSACSGAGGGGSKVIETITGDAARVSTTLRITLGETTKKSDLNKFIKALKAHIKKTRAAQNSLTNS